MLLLPYTDSKIHNHRNTTRKTQTWDGYRWNCQCPRSLYHQYETTQSYVFLYFVKHLLNPQLLFSVCSKAFCDHRTLDIINILLWIIVTRKCSNHIRNANPEPSDRESATKNNKPLITHNWTQKRCNHVFYLRRSGTPKPTQECFTATNEQHTRDTIQTHPVRRHRLPKSDMGNWRCGLFRRVVDQPTKQRRQRRMTTPCCAIFRRSLASGSGKSYVRTIHEQQPSKSEV